MPPHRRVKRSAPVGILQGYHTVTGMGHNTALRGKTERHGGTSSVKYRVCAGIQELSEAMEVNQSLTVGFASIASVEEKLKFIRSLKVTTYSTCIVAYARHIAGMETATNVALAPDIKAPNDKEALKEFVESYGDCYLSSRTEGGEYYGVYTLYTETRQEQTALEVEIKAQGIFSPVSVDGSLQAKLNKFVASQKMRITFEQSISGITNPSFPTSDKIIQFAVDFPSLPLTAPLIIGFETAGYEGVPGIGSAKFGAVARNRKSVAGLKSAVCRLQHLQNDILSIQQTYSIYGGYHEDAKLRQVEAQAANDEKAMGTIIEGYVNDPTNTVTQPIFQSLAHGVPSLRYVIGRSDRFGGSGGVPFQDVDERNHLQQRTRISALRIRAGNEVGNFTVTYTSTDGRRKVINHGADNSGPQDQEVEAPKGLLVERVVACYDNLVTRLQVTCADGKRVDAGSTSGRETFKWDVPTGSFVVGFSGRCGFSLDALQVVYASFRPAAWEPPKKA